MSHNREWMYSPYENGGLRDEFVNGIETFIEFASSHMDGEKLKCPCKLRNCRNTRFLDPYIVRSHLIKYGFVPNYYTWIHHGETSAPIGNQTVDDEETNLDGGEEAASTVPHTNVINAVVTPQLNVENNEEEHSNFKASHKETSDCIFCAKIMGNAWDYHDDDFDIWKGFLWACDPKGDGSFIDEKSEQIAMEVYAVAEEMVDQLTPPGASRYQVDMGR